VKQPQTAVRDSATYTLNLAQHRPAGKGPTLAWLKAPPKQVATATFTLAIKADSEDEKLVVRYRLDNGEWQKAEAFLVKMGPEIRLRVSRIVKKLGGRQP
jgi:hypothetical protein